MQGSGEQRAEEAAAGDAELPWWDGSLVAELCRGFHCLSCLLAVPILFLVPPQPCDRATNLGGHTPGEPPMRPASPQYPALTMADAVLVDSLHLAQQMVQSLSLASSPRGTAVVLPPV